MRSESGDIHAEEAAAANPGVRDPDSGVRDAESADQPVGGEAAETATSSLEETSQEPAGALDPDAPEELNCYDPEDPTTNIAGEQEFAETSGDEYSDNTDLGEEGDLTKEFLNGPPSEQLPPPEFIEKQIALLAENRFLVLYSKTLDVVEDIAYALARQWSDAARRYYTPDPNTTNAEPFSLRDVVEKLTVSGPTLLLVFDNSQITFSPLVSRAYIGPRAHEFLALLQQRKVCMLVVSKYDTVEHVRKIGNASGLIKYFSLVESPEHEPSEPANPSEDGLQDEALFLLWCSAFFPDLSVDDLFGIVNRMIENTILDPEMAQASKQRLRKNLAAICAGSGLSITADAAGIVRFKFELPKSPAGMQNLFRTKGRLDHIHALQVFFESGAMLDLKGRSLQIAAASIALLARTDPSALGENLLLRSATASRSHPDVIQWWESDDFDPPPTALLNLLQAELVSLVRLGDSPLAVAALKALCRLKPSLVIGLLSRCPPDYVCESWYLDACIDALRHVSRQHVRLKSFRRLIRIASRKPHAGPERACPSAVVGLANLTAAIYRSAIQPLCGDYHSCFIDAALLGQQEQRETIHELLCSVVYRDDMAKVLSGPLRSQILLQSLSGWNWTAPRSKIDMWIKQRLLAEGSPVQVFAATSALFGRQRDADAEMKPASTSSGVVFALLLLDHDASISCLPDDANASQKIPVALKALFAREKAALRETIAALAELSRYFSVCSSRMNAVTMRAARQELETFAKIRRSLNRYAGMAVSLKKFIDKEAGN